MIWGLINALLFIPLLVTGKNRNNLDDVAAGRLVPNLKEFFQMAWTFSLVCLTWIFFRAENFTQATSYLTSIFQNVNVPINWEYFDKITLAGLFVLLFFDWFVWFCRVSVVMS